mmetsp:Transcript_12737/g.37207  ORF Transcript_12737/g.37207 Transcript_12737/m.37207 type:complete len:278 (-) Transcript_12737:196-1029(-)
MDVRQYTVQHTPTAGLWQCTHASCGAHNAAHNASTSSMGASLLRSCRRARRQHLVVRGMRAQALVHVAVQQLVGIDDVQAAHLQGALRVGRLDERVARKRRLALVRTQLAAALQRVPVEEILEPRVEVQLCVDFHLGVEEQQVGWERQLLAQLLGRLWVADCHHHQLEAKLLKPGLERGQVGGLPPAQRAAQVAQQPDDRLPFRQLSDRELVALRVEHLGGRARERVIQDEALLPLLPRPPCCSARARRAISTVASCTRGHRACMGPSRGARVPLVA